MTTQGHAPPQTACTAQRGASRARRGGAAAERAARAAIAVPCLDDRQLAPGRSSASTCALEDGVHSVRRQSGAQASTSGCDAEPAAGAASRAAAASQASVATLASSWTAWASQTPCWVPELGAPGHALAGCSLRAHSAVPAGWAAGGCARHCSSGAGAAPAAAAALPGERPAEAPQVRRGRRRGPALPTYAELTAAAHQWNAAAAAARAGLHGDEARQVSSAAHQHACCWPCRAPVPYLHPRWCSAARPGRCVCRGHAAGLWPDMVSAPARVML